MSAVQNRYRKQVNQSQIYRQQAHKYNKIQQAAFLGNITRHFGDSDNAAQFLAAAFSGNHLPNPAQRGFGHVPGLLTGFLDGPPQRQFFLFGHWEYDRETLAKEYFRDKEKGLPIQIPYSYFPDDDPENKPIFNWSCSANLLYSNWLNYCIYQKTPYDLNELEPLGTAQ